MENTILITNYKCRIFTVSHWVFYRIWHKLLGKLVTCQLRYEIILILGLCLDLLSNLHDKTNNFSQKKLNQCQTKVQRKKRIKYIMHGSNIHMQCSKCALLLRLSHQLKFKNKNSQTFQLELTHKKNPTKTLTPLSLRTCPRSPRI